MRILHLSVGYGRTNHYWTLLYVSIPALTLKAHYLVSMPYLSPFPTVAANDLFVYLPECSRLVVCYWSVMLGGSDIPCGVHCKTRPQGEHEYFERVKHFFHHVYLCFTRILYVFLQTYLKSEYCLLRYKHYLKFRIPCINPKTAEEHPSFP